MALANVNMDYLYPEFWAAGFDALDVGEYNLQNFVSRDTEAQLASFGDTVNVPITPDFGDAADWTPGSTITPSNTTQTQAQVQLNQSKSQVRGFTDKELSLSKYSLIESYAAPMAKSILRSVNKSLYLELLKTPYFVDATANIAASHVADAETKLYENEVGAQNRRLVGSPGMIGALRKLSEFNDASKSNNDAIVKDGAITRQYGFDIYQNNIISKYTPADLTGAVNNSGTAYAAGATTIAVDGFNDDSNPIRVGDTFKIADETGTPWHTVTATTTSSSDTVSITFTPAIIDGAADNAVVTFTATQSLLAFTPGAVAFAARAYQAANKPGVNSSVINVGGLPIRISTWTNSSTLDLNVQYDILYGMTMVQPKRCVRILEDA